MFRFRFSLHKKIYIYGNTLLSLSFYVYCLIIWLILFGWVIFNEGHIKTDDYMHSTVSLKTREAIFTNFSAKDFNTTYVKPNEFENYNRIWDRNDFVTFFPNEIHIMTNVAITANQTQSICPDNPLIKNVECDPKNNKCRKGFKTSNGILTGRCVVADFPLNHFHERNNGYACEMQGWCPVDRMLVPLNNYKPVLLGTINSTLYVDNSVEFPNKQIELNNLAESNCYYHPKTHPNCPIFKLGEIVQYTKNAYDTYEELAKFGATIMINIDWRCFYPLFGTFECKPEYSFRRVDVWQNHTQIIYYTKAFYNSNGDKRKLVRSFKIRYEVKVKATLREYDLFNFITNNSAYTGVFSLMLWLFTYFVRHRLHRFNIDDNVDIGQGANRLDCEYGFEESSQLIVSENTINSRNLSDKTLDVNERTE